MSIAEKQTEAASQELKVVQDATCTFCGCVCDDMELTVQDGKIATAREFFADRGEPPFPGLQVREVVESHEPHVCRDVLDILLRAMNGTGRFLRVVEKSLEGRFHISPLSAIR